MIFAAQSAPRISKFYSKCKNDPFPKSQIPEATSHSTNFCACVCELKDTDEVLPVKTARSARHGSYSFEFCRGGIMPYMCHTQSICRCSANRLYMEEENDLFSLGLKMEP